MKCLNPVRFYRSDDGSISHTWYKCKSVKDISFHPCQYCINCRLRRAESNAIRMVHESSFHDSSLFLTLTYSPEFLPQSRSLVYSDVSKFMNRLRSRRRRAGLSAPILFYRSGEYGLSGDRGINPHYHLIVFGHDFSDRRYVASKDDRKYYKSDSLDSLWGKGFADIGDVDFSTCMYVSKYVTKKLYGSDASEYGDRLPESSSCSKGFKYPRFYRNSSTPHPRAGERLSFPIGHRWIEKYFRDVYPHDYVFHNGRYLHPPRYYDDWLKANKPDLWSIVSSKRVENANLSLDVRDLHAKHFIRVQRQSKFSRDGMPTNLRLDYELLRRRFSDVHDFKEV